MYICVIARLIFNTITVKTAIKVIQFYNTQQITLILL